MIRSGSQKRTLLWQGLGCNHLNQIRPQTNGYWWAAMSKVKETNRYSQAHYRRSKQASKRYEEEVATLVLQKKAKLQQNCKISCATSCRAGCTHHSQDCGLQTQHIRSYRMRSASSPTTNTEWGTLSAVAGDPSAVYHGASAVPSAVTPMLPGDRSGPWAPCQVWERGIHPVETHPVNWRTEIRCHVLSLWEAWLHGEELLTEETGKPRSDTEVKGYHIRIQVNQQTLERCFQMSRQNQGRMITFIRGRRASQTRVKKPHLRSLCARQGHKQRTLYHLT